MNFNATAAIQFLIVRLPTSPMPRVHKPVNGVNAGKRCPSAIVKAKTRVTKVHGTAQESLRAQVLCE